MDHGSFLHAEHTQEARFEPNGGQVVHLRRSYFGRGIVRGCVKLVDLLHRTSMPHLDRAVFAHCQKRARDIITRHAYHLVRMATHQHSERAAIQLQERQGAVLSEYGNLVAVDIDVTGDHFLVERYFGDQLGEVGGPEAQVAFVTRARQEEGLRGFCARILHQRLDGSVRHLNYLVNLARKEVDDVDQAVLGRHIHAYWLLCCRFLVLLNNLVGHGRVVENFAARCIIKCD